MAQYTAAAATMSAISAAAAIVCSAESYARHDHLYRTSRTDENSPFQPGPRQRAPFASMRARPTYGYYDQPLYYPPGLHEHYIHHDECPGSQCHYRAFLTDSIQRYNQSRRDLRQTYVWNLHELARLHASQPQKLTKDKDAEADRLYAYYVSRVRDVFEEHRQDHRRLFGQDYLCWAQPEREDPAQLLRNGIGSRLASRMGTTANEMMRNTLAPSAAATPAIKESREEERSESSSNNRVINEG
ncbi:uncharacterized protein F4822DRAFT_440572 [Hypoxylon trugodes]|uniref:uncharacterized protein n=1 Tax=Hypoxylon trugodes TaxID=326681 RepID=UPI00218E3D02|nr:uncharacterized protein F4822DRAFT_440572 [Hypoxylon trugodes]KAI1383556.1 hypothetical protein F4822DRAFT_440572 [Hypoxylon trugodes]